MSAPPSSSQAATATPRSDKPSAAIAPAETDDTTATPHITCFACSRCEYPICDHSELLLRKVRQGASEYAFQYNLEGLLDLDDQPVPCYSAAEVVHTSVVVSEALMKTPLPPAAQVVALESIVQSRKFWVQQRRSMNARLHEHDVAAASLPAAAAATTSTDPPAPSSSSSSSSPSTAADASADAPSALFAAPVGSNIVRRYGDSMESRIDLVCVKDTVLLCGVQECTQDRSAAATSVEGGSEGSGSTSEDRSGDDTAAPPPPTVVRDTSFSHVPADVLKAATAAAAETQWSSPGNMSLREAFMEVNRSTLSSRAPWFQDYRCVSRVQCPDCHQPLGFVFHVTKKRKKDKNVPAKAAEEVTATPTQGLKRPAARGTRDEDDEEERREGRRVNGREEGVDGTDGDARARTVASLNAGSIATAATAAASATTNATSAPHAKKTRNERDAQAAATATTRRTFQDTRHQQQQQQQEQQQQQQQPGESETRLPSGNTPTRTTAVTTDGHDASGTPVSGQEAEGARTEEREDGGDEAVEAPPRFIGLELKRLVQREWDLHAFQERYSKSCDLSTFRELFPEAEELQSLYSRLLGLRTQTELYNSLLRRHKEQNDVQMALLNSNKDRMHTYDEKIKTMQQIIEAQRAQIEMQTRQIRNQEELVQSHRRQFVTQQRQMDVEQLLLTQQSKTIESQKEQLRLLKEHFHATKPEILRDLQMRSSPPSLPSDAQKRERFTRGQSAEQPPQPEHAQEEENDAEGDEDWSDVDGGSSSREAHAERAAAPQPGSRYQSTPPAHLCGVPTSFPLSRVPRGEPSKTAVPPRSPSPP